MWPKDGNVDDGLLTWRDVCAKGSLATTNGAYVYAICDSIGEVIYVGSTTRLRQRLGKHFAWPRKNRRVPGRWPRYTYTSTSLSIYLQEHAAEVLEWQVFFVRCDCEDRARSIEGDLIWRWAPYFNSIGRCDFSPSRVPTPALPDLVCERMDLP